MKTVLKLALCTTALGMMSTQALAVPIYGGSDLVSAGDAAQLQQWRGAGAMTLTNIFDKEYGDTSYDFHNAVDGMGATFTVVEVLGNHQGFFDAPILVGGYNPVSWDASKYNYTYTYNNNDRNAFMFNLSTDTVLYQRQQDWRGVYQTYNRWNYGPTFGGGHDLYVRYDLNWGYMNPYTYSTQPYYWYNSGELLGENGSSLRIGQIEVFAVDAAAVPEPGMLGLLAIGGAGLFVARRRRSS